MQIYIAYNGVINMKGCIRNVIKSLIYSYRLFDKVVSLVPQEFPEIICLRGRVGKRQEKIPVGLSILFQLETH